MRPPPTHTLSHTYTHQLNLIVQAFEKRREAAADADIDRVLAKTLSSASTASLSSRSPSTAYLSKVAGYAHDADADADADTATGVGVGAGVDTGGSDDPPTASDDDGKAEGSGRGRGRGRSGNRRTSMMPLPMLPIIPDHLTKGETALTALTASTIESSSAVAEPEPPW